MFGIPTTPIIRFPPSSKATRTSLRDTTLHKEVRQETSYVCRQIECLGIEVYAGRVFLCMYVVLSYLVREGGVWKGEGRREYWGGEERGIEGGREKGCI